MGFDLHGLNPQSNTPQPQWTKGEPFIKVEGKDHQYEIDPQIKEEYDDYMKSKWEWQDTNDGAYFRNNVWAWRPLWHFVTCICEDFLTEEDINAGSFNDGYKISKIKAKRIASRLRKLLEKGDVTAYESAYSRNQKKMSDKDWNKSYPFSEKNVRNFERFCEKSGGFEIW